MGIIASDKQQAPQASWPIYRALVGVGLACTLIIITVYVTSKPIIERNQTIALNNAIYSVIPGATQVLTLTLNEQQQFTPQTLPGAVPVHAGFDAEGALLGFALPAKSMGYQDTISVLYGYSPQEQAIVGMRVLQSKETPGLGDKIEKDSKFKANFDRLDVALTEDGKRLEHPLQMVKSGQKQFAWQIDAITGATISSKAITTMLRDSTQHWIPILNSQLANIVGMRQLPGKEMGHEQH